MKKLILLIGLVFLVAAFFKKPAQVKQLNPQEFDAVTLTPSIIPLGTVIYGDVAKAVFTFTNFTPLPIKITRVATSCGCTKAQAEKDELQAYESTKINVAFDPAVHQDDTDLGDLTRTIYITTDNPNFSDLESMITATVIKKN